MTAMLEAPREGRLLQFTTPFHMQSRLNPYKRKIWLPAQKRTGHRKQWAGRTVIMREFPTWHSINILPLLSKAAFPKESFKPRGTWQTPKMEGISGRTDTNEKSHTWGWISTRPNLPTFVKTTTANRQTRSMTSNKIVGLKKACKGSIQNYKLRCHAKCKT